MNTESTSIDAAISKLDSILPKNFTYLPNPGNAGDSLIAASTYQIFEKIGRNPEILHTPENIDNKIIVLGGGGNLIPIYREMRTFLEVALSQKAKQIIILPHTIRGNEDLLEKLRSQDIVFTREQESLRHTQLNTKAHCHLMHDLAFNFDIEKQIHRQEAFVDLPKVFFKKLSEFNDFYFMLGGKGTFFRTDGESKGNNKIRYNADLSILFQFGVLPTNAEKSVACLIKALNCFERIETDRLHIGILASLCGKQTTLYDNNYGKNFSVLQESPIVFPRLNIK